MACVNCDHCKYPRSADDNGGACKCKIMKYKTIDVYVTGSETPAWCPLSATQPPAPIRIQAVGKKALCRSCGAPILWIKTPAGKSMPCDATPVYYKDVEKGPDKVVALNGVTVSCEIVTNLDEADGFGYIPHWSTCDSPDKFRKR